MTPFDSSEIKTEVDFQQELQAGRIRIDAIDQQIVALLAQRQKAVNRILEIKKRHQLPVFHPAREENLISNRRQQGKAAGLDPNFLEELFRCIMRQSRREQTAGMVQQGIRPGATVLIVGGQGEMGRYFCRLFSGAGYHVRVLERGDWDQVQTLCRGADLVVLSVPIDVTGAVARQIAPHLGPECILADITSLKTLPMKAMLEAHNGPVIGLHPLFGPTTSSLDKQIVVVTPGHLDADCQWLVDQFAAWGAIILTANPEEHDEMMGIVQTLRHFATFCFGQFLYRRGVDLNRTLEFSSPIYRLEMGMVGRLFAQDPALYAEIIFASTRRRQLLKDFVASVTQNLAMVEASDKAAFVQEFKNVAAWFGPFGEQAIRESSFLIDKLIERF
jgi:chorismate mutase/prephenate dehydrogenase